MLPKVWHVSCAHAIGQVTCNIDVMSETTQNSIATHPRLLLPKVWPAVTSSSLRMAAISGQVRMSCTSASDNCCKWGATRLGKVLSRYVRKEMVLI